MRELTCLYSISSRLMDMRAFTHEIQEGQGADSNGHIEACDHSYVPTTNGHSTMEGRACAMPNVALKATVTFVSHPVNALPLRLGALRMRWIIADLQQFVLLSRAPLLWRRGLHYC